MGNKEWPQTSIQSHRTKTFLGHPNPSTQINTNSLRTTNSGDGAGRGADVGPRLRRDLDRDVSPTGGGPRRPLCWKRGRGASPEELSFTSRCLLRVVQDFPSGFLFRLVSDVASYPSSVFHLQGSESLLAPLPPTVNTSMKVTGGVPSHQATFDPHIAL